MLQLCEVPGLLGHLRGCLAELPEWRWVEAQKEAWSLPCFGAADVFGIPTSASRAGLGHVRTAHRPVWSGCRTAQGVGELGMEAEPGLLPSKPVLIFPCLDVRQDPWTAARPLEHVPGPHLPGTLPLPVMRTWKLVSVSVFVGVWRQAPHPSRAEAHRCTQSPLFLPWEQSCQEEWVPEPSGCTTFSSSNSTGSRGETRSIRRPLASELCGQPACVTRCLGGRSSEPGGCK